MVQTVNRDAYRDQIHALLPSGRAWPEEAGTTLDDLVRAIAAEFADIDLSDARLLDEIRPDSTVDLLPDWERVLGLPDSCSQLSSRIAIRRASLLAKLVAQPTMNPSAYEAVAAEFGIDITVYEHDQARADADPERSTRRAAAGVTSGGSISRRPRDVQEFTTLSDVTEALRTVERNTELECRLQKARSPRIRDLVRRLRVRAARPAVRASPSQRIRDPTGSDGKTRPTGWATCPTCWRRPGRKRFRGSR